MTRLIVLTDTRGLPVQGEDQMFEPQPSSVVLVCGVLGTAWQRYGSDGLWHSPNQPPRDWSWVVSQRNVVLIHDAPERGETR